MSADETLLGVIKEVTPGVTPATPAFDTMRISSEGVNLETQVIEATGLSSARGVSDAIVTGAKVAGTISGELYANTVYEDFMASVLGGLDTWPLSKILPDWNKYTYTIERAATAWGTTYYQRYAGCTISAMTISATAGEVAKISFDVVGGAQTESATTDGTYTAASPTPANAPAMRLADASIVWGGALSSVLTDYVDSIEISIDGQNRGIQTIGTLGDKDVLLGRLKVTGSGKSYFVDNTFYTAARAASDATLALTFTDTAGTPQSSTFNFDRFRVTKSAANARGTGEDLIDEFDWEALTLSGGDQVRIAKA